MSQRVTIAQALDLAVQHHNAGRLDEAEEIYNQILAALPDQQDALHLLGLVANERGDNERAADLIERAIAIAPEVGEMHGNLALVLQDLGRLEEAAERLERALALSPDFAEGHNNLGLLRHELGQPAAAAVHFERALEIAPDFAEAHGNLGNALLQTDRPDEAAIHYRKALDLAPDQAGVLANLGMVLLETGDADGALASVRQAVALAPETDDPWIAFALCVERMTFDALDDDLRGDLLRLLDHPATDPTAIAPAIFDACKPALASDAPTPTDELLLRALVLCPVMDRTLEAALTTRRRVLLDGVPEGALPFACALAQQCFLNEYVFAVTADEEARIDALAAGVAAALENGAPLAGADLVMLGAYRPLYAFGWADRLAGLSWDEPIAAAVTQQIAEPLEEHRLRSAVSAATPIEDAVSAAVRDQYEANPYPRWSRFAARHSPAPIDTVLRGAPLRFDIGDYYAPETPEVLIAGCGTGQQALLAASRYAGARILAVDLSLSSLGYATRKTRDLGVETIDYAQADILMLGALDRRFDLIECVGVLHHMDDPLAGWRVLTGLLRPGGVMKIGLYSEAARQDVVAARSLIAEQGFAPTPEGIREARAAIAERADNGDALMASIAIRNSFFSASECRDLIFHVQEHRFTLPQIADALEALGLTFLGFEMRDPAPLAAFREAHGDALTDLSLWHEFETAHPDTFRGMYQFWVRNL